ncbi:hypothetical protein LG315_04990 [Microbacterium marinum]|nr:hypothetical protein [Microbacterium marinum]HCJ48632.1 hypothetical protein [Microbacterium sp.]
MRMGTRWDSGAEPPASVPALLHEQIAVVDATVTLSGVQPKPRWTLTWLEGRPVAELETGAVVRQDRDGQVVVGHVDALED